MRKYFGTDGIRGEANKELTVDLALRLGYALGYYLKENNKNKKKIRVVMGSDTRISGYMLRSALMAGLTSMGIDIDFVGVLPTPGVAYLTKASDAVAGIMISASHNPAKDNGIKIFAQDGYKLPDEVELKLESLMDNLDEITKDLVPGDKVGQFKYADDEYYLYRDHLLSTVNGDFSGMKIIIDAANGSAYRIAKSVFLKLGAEIVIINDAPNGTNINVKCGSTHPEILAKVVVGYEADLGLAYDGDADRLIAVDRFGNIIDGDKIIAILALEMKKKNELRGNKVVTTVMSNMGFETYLEEKGAQLLRANVGDRYVLEMMKNEGANLGGEQSGHMIFLDYNTTGDGVLSSLVLAQIVKEEGKTLSNLASVMTQYPQVLVNARIKNENKNRYMEIPEIKSEIERIEKLMDGSGRVLIRPSGTEPLVRVMLEGKDEGQLKELATNLANLIQEKLS